MYVVVNRKDTFDMADRTSVTIWREPFAGHKMLGVTLSSLKQFSLIAPAPVNRKQASSSSQQPIDE